MGDGGGGKMGRHSAAAAREGASAGSGPSDGVSVRKTLCRVEDVPQGGATSREVDSSTGGFSLVITRVGDVVRAFHNECPHAGRRLDWAPGKVLVEAGTLVCAAHGAQFMLDSGACIGGPCRGAGLKPVAVSVDGDDVVLG